MKKKLLGVLCFGGIFIALIVLFALGLKGNPSELSLATKNKPIPSFSLPSLLNDKVLENADLTTDQDYYLVNFWGSWCSACYDEHAYLIELAKDKVIYGVNWRDQYPLGKQFIERMGNPFKSIIVDAHSILAIGMGVYGAPETFLISADSRIMYRYAGVMTPQVWEKEFIPRIRTLKP